MIYGSYRTDDAEADASQVSYLGRVVAEARRAGANRRGGRPRDAVPLPAGSHSGTADIARAVPPWSVGGRSRINIQSSGWYVKLCIDHDTPEVAVISFHPPEHPMRTPAGVVKPP